MTPNDSRDDKLDQLLELASAIHAELTGSPHPRTRLRLVADDPPPAPAPERLAKVIEFRRRAG